MYTSKPFKIIYENEKSTENGAQFLVREHKDLPHHYLISDGGSYVGGGKLLKKYCKPLVDKE